MAVENAAVDQVRVRILPDGRMRRPDAARYIGVSEKTLANMRTRGEGPPPTRILGRIFYYRSDLDRFIRGDSV
jgi:hypothetical protein